MRNWFNKLICAKAGDEGGDSLSSFMESHFDQSASTDGGGETQDKETENSDSETNEEDENFIEDSGDEDGTDSEEDESEDDGTEDNSDDEVQADLKEELAALKAQNEMLMKLLNSDEKEEQEKEQKIENPINSEIFTNLAEVMNWDSEEQSLMKNFFELMMDYNKATAVEEASKTIPEIVNSTMTNEQKKKSISEKFYADNPELAEVKSYVSALSKEVTTELKAKGGPLSAEKILNETAKRAYKILGIKKGKKVEEKKPERGKKPPFASKTGSRKKAAKQSAMEKDIAAMIELG